MRLFKRENFNKKIKEILDYDFGVNERGLYAISITATCRSEKQIKQRGGEDLRIEIDGQNFREIPPEKNIQLFNVPSSWNGTKLKDLKKTVVFILWLEKGNHKISFIPHKGAKLEDLEIKELGQNVKHRVFNINEQAEDGDRRPWYTFALINLPLKHLSVETTVQKRLWDSDDVKIIVDGDTKRNIEDGKHIFWYIVGGVLGWIIYRLVGKKKRIKSEFDESLSPDIHYIEFYADKTPILHNVELDFGERIDFRIRAKIVWSPTNLREEPTSKSRALIEKIGKDEQVAVIEKTIEGERYRNETNGKLLATNRWHKVEYQGKTGYIYSLTLEIEGENKENVQKIIIEKSKDFRLDPEILLALSKCESEFFPYTVSFDKERPEIAFGVMQISGDLLNDLEDYFDLEQNIQRGVRYFNDQYNKKYKNDDDRLRKSIAAYNAGPGHVEVNEPLELELYDPETQRIVPCVQNHLRKKAFKNFLKDLTKVGISLFLIFQLLSLYDVLVEPENKANSYSGINSEIIFTEEENLDEKLQLDPQCVFADGEYMGEEFCKRYKEWADWD